MTAETDSGTTVASTGTVVERDAVDGDVNVDDVSVRFSLRGLSVDDSGASSAARKYAVTVGLASGDPVGDAGDRVCFGCRAIWRKARASAGVA